MYSAVMGLRASAIYMLIFLSYREGLANYYSKPITQVYGLAASPATEWNEMLGGSRKRTGQPRNREPCAIVSGDNLTFLCHKDGSSRQHSLWEHTTLHTL